MHLSNLIGLAIIGVIILVAFILIHALSTDKEQVPEYIYVVTLYRFGFRHELSYIIGAFLTEDEAEYAAAKEEAYRNNEYEAEIVRINIVQRVKATVKPLTRKHAYSNMDLRSGSVSY